ncbi:MAG: single-stranded DNA-binding protein [Oscillospiraceae bacterium]|nr:single-stranded DNA-binding protein [Oscillospiraceae bacterium]
MEEQTRTNLVELCGTAETNAVFSHESRGERFYRFPLTIHRLSGTADTLNVIVREHLLSSAAIAPGQRLQVSGELRSFNNKHSEGSKLVITVFAHSLLPADGADANSVALRGTLCKLPNLRTTPMGREICDFMLAVNRHYGRSDYLPCIAWGIKAKETAQWPVGTVVSLTGRVQSRQYVKVIEGAAVEKTAFEVSVVEIHRVD